MKNNKSNKVKSVLGDVLAEIGQSEDKDEAVQKILEALDDKKILRYHRDNEISLLSTAGRVLVSLMSDSTMTIRALSVYLDLSETMVDKTVKQLIAHGLITKTKVNRQNVYRFNEKTIMSQPDIQQFMRAISSLEAPNGKAGPVVDDSPF